MKQTIKTFEDLEFENNPFNDIRKAVIKFENGCIMTVVHDIDGGFAIETKLNNKQINVGFGLSRQKVDDIMQVTQENWIYKEFKDKTKRIMRSEEQDRIEKALRTMGSGKKTATNEELEEETEKHVTNPNDLIYPTGYEGAGLTKREYFAAKAMSGLSTWSSDTAPRMATEAVKIADALIAALNK